MMKTSVSFVAKTIVAIKNFEENQKKYNESVDFSTKATHNVFSSKPAKLSIKAIEIL